MKSSVPAFLLLAPPGDFYAYLLKGLSDAFLSLGYPAGWHAGAIDHERLAPLLRRFNVAACLEINRVRRTDSHWPAHTAHLAWIQDYRFNGQDLTQDLGRSDHLYFLMHPEAFGITLPKDRSWSMLLPGVRADARSPQDMLPRSDFSLVGFIPPPMDPDTQVSTGPAGQPVTLSAFLQSFPMEVLSQSCFSLHGIREAIAKTCAQLGCAPIEQENITQVFDEILPRTLDRKRLLETALAISTSLEIYGPPTWERWSQFAPYYRGFVKDPRDLDIVYQTTRINLHNSGLAMHFRVLDCLGAGGFLVINETPLDFAPQGIRAHFEPFRHYVPYQFDTLEETAREFLADEGARLKIAAEGRRAVMASHRWSERARQILSDLNLKAPTCNHRSYEPEPAEIANRLNARLRALA